jgi:hypothetical protein
LAILILVLLGNRHRVFPRCPLWHKADLAETFVVAALYVSYRLVDPLPPRHLAIAAEWQDPGTTTLRGNNLTKQTVAHRIELPVGTVSEQTR